MKKKIVSCFDIGEVSRSPGKWNWNWLYFLSFNFTFKQGVYYSNKLFQWSQMSALSASNLEFQKKISITRTILSHRRSEQFGQQNTKSNLTEKISLKIKQKLNDAGCIEGKLANDFQYTHNQPEIGSLSQTSADKRFPLLFTCYCQYRFWFPWLCISLVCILISIKKKYIHIGIFFDL